MRFITFSRRVCLALLGVGLLILFALLRVPTDSESDGDIGILTASDGRRLAEIEEIQRLADQGFGREALERARELRQSLDDGASVALVARSLDALLDALYAAGRRHDDEALAAAREALTLHEDAATELHLRVEARRRLARVLSDQERFEEAREILDGATVLASGLSPRSVVKSRLLRDRSALAADTGQLPLAGTYARQALDAARLAESPAEIAQSLTTLGNTLYSAARPVEALKHYTLAASEAARMTNLETSELGDPIHRTLARSLHNVGLLQHQLGDLPAASDAFERSLAIRRRLVGDVHPLIGLLLAVMARVKHDYGDYIEAQELFDRAEEVVRAAYGVDHRRFGQLLADRALLALDRGDPSTAEALLERSVRIATTTQGADHSGVLALRVWRASALAKLGREAEAEALLREAQQKLRLRARSHRELVEAHRQLALILWSRGDTSGALNALEEARSSLPDDDHLDAASVLESLAQVRLTLGESEKASALLAQAEDVARAVFDDDHPTRLRLQLLLASSRVGSERHEGVASMLAVAERQRARIRRQIRDLGDEEGVLLSTSLGLARDVAIKVLMGTEQVAPEELLSVWRLASASRALVLSISSWRYRLAHLASRDPERRALLERWQATQQRYGRQLLRFRSSMPEDGERRALLQAQAELRRTEAEFLQSSASDFNEASDFDRELDQVLAALPETAALVGFFSVGALTGSDPEVVAFVATSDGDRDNPIAFVQLGRERRLVDLVREWRQQLAKQDWNAQAQAAGAALRAALWDPIAPLLEGRQRILRVPAGELSLVDFSALPGPDGLFLVESGRIFQELVSEAGIPLAKAAPSRSGLVAVGAPSFEASAAKPILVGSRVDGHSSRRFSLCESDSYQLFTPLPGTLTEIEDVLDRWDEQTGGRFGPARSLLGTAASESNLREAAARASVLHIATHGFFLPTRCRLRNGGFAGRAESGLLHVPSVSGLALAGANRRTTADHLWTDDGILFSEEVKSLDLHGARLVVLSACDTGLGAVHQGEGVLGLRRAFHVAGAANLLMTLGAVDDSHTQRWIHELYTRILRSGVDIGQAVAETNRAYLARLRREGADPSPSLWAPFVPSSLSLESALDPILGGN